MLTVTRRPCARRLPRYAGLRMDATTYLRLKEDGHRYELVNGVVLLSPSPTPQHQHVAGEVLYQLMAFLRTHRLGNAFLETDVRLDDKLVYRPDLVFLRAERMAENWEGIHAPPDLVLEVVSPKNRRYDIETKKPDYERYGVREFWLIDPRRKTMAFYRLEAGRYMEIAPTNDQFASEAVPGFVLDLAEVRHSFEPLRG